MDRITVDSPLLKKLANCKEAVAVCDEFGHMVGVFEPAAFFGPQIDEAEMERRSLEVGEDYSTAEVLTYLESL